MPRAFVAFLVFASLVEAQTQSRSSWLALTEDERTRVEEHATAYKAFMKTCRRSTSGSRCYRSILRTRSAPRSTSTICTAAMRAFFVAPR